MSLSAELEATLFLAEQVTAAARERGADAVVIGAVALAVHGYPRDTVDLDLAVAMPPARLKELAEGLAIRGLQVEFREPDAQDPLGGVIDVQGPGGQLVQVVNFDNSPAGGFPRLVRESLGSASELAPGRALRVVDPYYLVAFKLYAGGSKSALDVLELLKRNPGVDRSRLAALCGSLGLGRDLEDVLRLERSL